MAKKENTQSNGQQQGAEVLKKCLDEKCTQKGTRAGFCTEHFTWFKEGLLTTEGQRPKDFDKKYQAYIYRNRKVS